MKPGSDIRCEAASSLTWRPPPLSASSTPRRVGSASAANTLLSTSSSYLTIRFSIGQSLVACQALVKLGA
jgi:hypothetical protein